MKNNRTYSKNKVWFARWARASWAAFRSLGIVVHIQNMSISAFKDTLLQQPGTSKKDTIRLFRADELLGLLLDWDIPWEDDILEQTLLIEFIETKNIEVAPALESASNKLIIPIYMDLPCL